MDDFAGYTKKFLDKVQAALIITPFKGNGEI